MPSWNAPLQECSGRLAKGGEDGVPASGRGMREAGEGGLARTAQR